MAKVTKKGEQTKTAAKSESKKTREKKSEQQKTVTSGASQKPVQKDIDEKSMKSYIDTTSGNRIDKIRVNYEGGDRMEVNAFYGHYNPEGKTDKERHKAMYPLRPRVLTGDDLRKYLSLQEKNSVEAKKFAAQAAFPMHVDDKAFHLKTTEINGRPVNYITTETITEETLIKNALRKEGVDVDHMSKDELAQTIKSLSPEVKAKAIGDNAGMVGKLQIAFGIKGDKESRFFGLANAEEKEMIRNRCEVKLDKDGNVVELGKPVTLAEIAARFENRVKAARSYKSEKIAKAENVNWNKFKLPEGVVSGVHYIESKTQSERVILEGKIAGTTIRSMLSKNETSAIKNRIATPIQVAAANKEFREKVLGMIALKAESIVIDRASSATKAFGPEDVKYLNAFADGMSAEEREKAFEGLWAKVEPQLKEKNVLDAWQADAHEELQGLARGEVRDEGQGMAR